MYEVIIYNGPDTGYCSVFHPAAGVDVNDPAIQAKVIPPGAQNINVVEFATLPTDQTFFDAWLVQPGGTVIVDLARAKGLWKEAFKIVFRLNMADFLLDGAVPALQSAITTANAQVDAALDVPAVQAIWPVGLPTMDFTEIGIGWPGNMML